MLYVPPINTTASSRAHVDVERHELVDDGRVGVVRRVPAELGERLGEPAELARRPGDVPDLDVVRVERGRGVEQHPAALVRLLARDLAFVDEEVGQELDLQVREAGVVEDLLHLRQRPRVELMLDVGVPEPDALEADPGCLAAAVLPLERAPLPADVHLRRTAHRPVEGQQIDLAHRRSSSLRGTEERKLAPRPGRVQPTRADVLADQCGRRGAYDEVWQFTREGCA
jgi:hypothetical protein